MVFTNKDKSKNASVALMFQKLENYAIEGVTGNQITINLEANGGRCDVYLKRVNTAKPAKFGYTF